MNIVNIYNKKNILYLFCRDNEGKLFIQKDFAFLPYYYEPDNKGEFIGFDNTKLKKITVGEPAEVAQFRSKDAYEADILYPKRYIIDKIDQFDKTFIKWAMIDIEVLHSEDEYPDPKEAKFPVVSITIYNNKYNKIRNWFIGDFGNDIKLAEEKLFFEFVTYLRKAKFDILLGYYMKGFDYPYCYSSDTEVMTEKGWILLKDIVDNKLKIKIATLNPKINKIKYDYPQDYIKYKYSGKMFYQGGKYINTLVTPNHRLWIKLCSPNNLGGHKYHFEEAQNTLKSITFKKDFPVCSKKNIKWFLLPGNKNSGWSKFRKNKKIKMNNWLQFLGWYLSEGHLYNNNNRTIAISQSKTANPANCKRIEFLLDRLQIGWSYHEHKYCFSSVQIYEYLKQFGLSYDKFIPRKFLNLSKKQSFILLQALIRGDGHVIGINKYGYCTVSKQLANDIQELALRSGFVASINKHKNTYILYINKRYINHTPNRIKDLRKYVDYNDYVYCLTVPNNLLFVRRKNNDYHWSGNCYNRFAKLPQKHFFIKESPYNNFAVAISPIQKVRGSGDRESNIFFPAGTSIIDYLEWIKRIYKGERDESLDGIAEKYLGIGKKFKDVDFSKLSNEIKERNINDIELMVALEKKFQLIPLFDEMRRMAKITFEDFTYPLRTVDSLILQEAKVQNIILPSSKGEEHQEEEFEGAWREVFETGLHFNVSKYDISGAYPSAIIDLCIDLSNLRDSLEENTIPVNITDRETNQVIKTCYLKQNPKAILPQIMIKLTDKKAEFKKILKELNPEIEEYKDAELKYEAVKVLVNTGWGVNGNRYFRLYNTDIASLITSSVRDVLHYLKDEIEKQGYEVLYTDTDGLIIADNGEDLSENLNRLIQKWSNERFNKSSTIKIEKEGTFIDIFISTLCRYIGHLQKKTGIKEEIKGLQIKRKDSTIFISEFQKEIFNRIFKKENEQQLIDFILNEKERLKTLPKINIALPVKLGRKIENYKTEVTTKLGKTFKRPPPIFVVALQNTQKLLPKFKKRVGEKYWWMYCYNENKEIITLAFDEKNQDHVKDICWSEMERRNIITIIEPIFEGMKWDLSKIVPQKVKKPRKKANDPKNTQDNAFLSSTQGDNRQDKDNLSLKNGDLIEPVENKEVTIKSQPTYTDKDFIDDNSSQESGYFKKELKYYQDMKRMKKDYQNYKKYLKSLNPITIGWLVGFWEGKGYIQQHKNTNYNYTLGLSQKDPTSLYKVKNILKTGTVSIIKYKNIKMGRYCLYSSGKILALIEILLQNIIGKYRNNQLNKIYNNLKKIKCY